MLTDYMIISVKVYPNKKVDKIVGIKNINGKNYIIVNLIAIPENNKANKALISLFSKILSIPQKNIFITSGAVSRIKMIKIFGWKNEFLHTLLDV